MKQPSQEAQARSKATFTDGVAAAYAGMLALRADPIDIGVIFDATGRDVLVVDVNATRSERDIEAIAALIIDAVNTHGGFLPRGA